MHYTKVTMKDGTVYNAPMYKRRPAEGWFNLMLGQGPDKIWYDDVAEAITENERINISRIGEDSNELVRAVEQGWTPKDKSVSPFEWQDVDEPPFEIPDDEAPGYRYGHYLDELYAAKTKDQKVVRYMKDFPGKHTATKNCTFYLVPKLEVVE